MGEAWIQATFFSSFCVLGSWNYIKAVVTASEVCVCACVQGKMGQSPGLGSFSPSNHLPGGLRYKNLSWQPSLGCEPAVRKDDLTTTALCKYLWFPAPSYVLHFLHPCLCAFSPARVSWRQEVKVVKLSFIPFFGGDWRWAAFWFYPSFWLPPLPWVGKTSLQMGAERCKGKWFSFLLFDNIYIFFEVGGGLFALWEKANRCA